MKKGYIIASLVFISLMFVYACGGTGGAPGSSGSEETGILIQAVSIIGDDDTPDDVDVYAHPTLCDGDPEDPITKETATMTITADLVNPLYDAFPGSVEKCTITYLKADEDPASPIIEKLTDYPNCPIFEGDNECIVDLIDINRKWKWWDDVYYGVNVPAEYPTHYVAVFKCKYMNISDGKSGTFQVEYDFRLADFNTCS